MAFVAVPAGTSRATSWLHRNSRRPNPRQHARCPFRKPRAFALVSGEPGTSEGVSTSTEDTFAIDAGRDLFFPGMDAKMAIQILDADLGSLEQSDDRFIAAERLKFFPSDEAASAIIRFVRKFDESKMSEYVLEDKVARRKAVESLGRYKGQFRRADVINLLSECLHASDKYMVETVIWALAEMGVTENREILKAVTALLDSENVEKRVVIQTLMRASHTPALPKIRPFVDSGDPAVASAAMTAVAKLSCDNDVMAPVVDILKAKDVNTRRAAIEDITLSKFVPALEHVAICPNSLVLRSRTVRVLLDVMNERNSASGESFHDDTFAIVDRLIWDHPGDLDLLDIKKETRRARDIARNVRQLYKNDAVYAYAAAKCLAEDHRGEPSGTVGAQVKKSYDDLNYFDYFGAYHVYKTLGWLQYPEAFDMLVHNAESLPPRFFNHQAGAITALAELGNAAAIPTIRGLTQKPLPWEVKYACLIAAERLGDTAVRSILKDDEDWLIRGRASSTLHFSHLRNTF